MDYKDLRIVFMGTPEFAVASLAKLVEAGCTVAAVVTMPDKPAGRGMKLQQSAVKQYAVAHGLPVLQPEKLRSKKFIADLKSLNVDLQIVVAFRMLPEMVWNMPAMGTINLHGSLLPQYRGAAPINWAVINGEHETGVTTFKLKHEIDTGDILLQDRFGIAEEDTAGIVHDKMMHIGADLLLETVKQIAAQTIQEVPQSNADAELKAAPKLFPADCKIDWNNSVDTVYNRIRGLSPYPGAFTTFNDKSLKIFSAVKDLTKPVEEPGTAVVENYSYIKFACTDGYIIAREVQLEGRKRMPVGDFVRGLR